MYFCYVLLVSLFISSSSVRSQDNFCRDHGYTPKHGSRKPAAVEGFHYFNNAVIHYQCDEGYKLNTSEAQQICKIHKSDTSGWQPSTYPGCIEVEDCGDLVVENGYPLPGPHYEGAVFTTRDIVCHAGFEVDELVTTTQCLSNGSWSNILSCKDSSEMYCSKPPNIGNGVILCCADVPKDDQCCPVNGKVQFECEAGYILQGGMPEMICGYDSKWYWNGANGHVYQFPECVSIPPTTTAVTRVNELQLSSQMIHTVIGVAVGVFALLLFVIALAFCKPKLKDIKRRWRDMREDEHGLIVNGQRVALPTYEQATSCGEQLWCDSYNGVGTAPPVLNSLVSMQHPPSSLPSSQMTRMPESNLIDDLLVTVTQPPRHRDVTAPDLPYAGLTDDVAHSSQTFGQLAFLPSQDTSRDLSSEESRLEYLSQNRQDDILPHFPNETRLLDVDTDGRYLDAFSQQGSGAGGEPIVDNLEMMVEPDNISIQSCTHVL